jgi:hypothetical protein
MMTATVLVIVLLLTIIVMGGATEWLLDALGIEMEVDEELYMENWHPERALKGPFHSFGTENQHHHHHRPASAAVVVLTISFFPFSRSLSNPPPQNVDSFISW